MKTERESEIRILVEEKRWEDLADIFVNFAVFWLANKSESDNLNLVLQVIREERMEMVARGISQRLYGETVKFAEYEKLLRDKGDNRDADWFKVGGLLVDLLHNWPEANKTLWSAGILALAMRIDRLMEDKLDIRQKAFVTRVCGRVIEAVKIVESE